MESIKYVENYFECNEIKYCLKCVISYLNPLECTIIKIYKTYEIYDCNSHILLNCDICDGSLIYYI